MSKGTLSYPFPRKTKKTVISDKIHTVHIEDCRRKILQPYIYVDKNTKFEIDYVANMILRESFVTKHRTDVKRIVFGHFLSRLLHLWLL